MNALGAFLWQLLLTPFWALFGLCLYLPWMIRCQWVFRRKVCPRCGRGPMAAKTETRWEQSPSYRVFSVSGRSGGFTFGRMETIPASKDLLTRRFLFCPACAAEIPAGVTATVGGYGRVVEFTAEDASTSFPSPPFAFVPPGARAAWKQLNRN